MVSPWKSPLFVLPADGATVFIRRLTFGDKPALATFDLAALTFTVIATTIVLPASLIQGWRPS